MLSRKFKALLKSVSRSGRSAVRRRRFLSGVQLSPRLESLEQRFLLAADFGDAPDLTSGAAAGDYETLLANGGPSHTIDATQTTLFLGASVDGDDGTLQNVTANADDVDGALPDDEDGVLSPATDLIGTVGAAPTVTLLVTNTTGSAATLNGWIDYNQDGVFDNATERAQASVADGTTDGRFTLTFPAIPDYSAGTTYARFRLSTDSAADNPTGTATDGEVEDYVFDITVSPILPLCVHDLVRIDDGGLSSGAPGGLEEGDDFGASVASIGDLNGDGVADVAVGATGGGSNGKGTVHVLFMNADGTVRSQTEITDGVGGLAAGTLDNYEGFGASVAAIGDLDGDGVTELAVGGSSGLGNAMYILTLNTDGTIRSQAEITSFTIPSTGRFGSSVTGIGDLNGDGVSDIAVGARSLSSSETGELHVLFLNADGTVQGHSRIRNGQGGLAAGTLTAHSNFGNAVANLGDVDGDGVIDLAVGASFDDNGDGGEGAVYVLLMNANGTVKSQVKISDGLNGFPANSLDANDRFGTAVAALGDLDGDGIVDLGVGAINDSDDISPTGAVHILLLNADGTVRSHSDLRAGLNGIPDRTFSSDSDFGSALAPVGDLDGDGVAELAVGAIGYGGGYGPFGEGPTGAVFILNLSPSPAPVDLGDAPDTGAGTGAGNYQTTAADNGPSHVITPGLQIGASIDEDDGTLQNAAADADDQSGGLDDEDGVTSPGDLAGTVGVAPTVNVLVTNTTGSAATLSGWIDYNSDGVFDNAAERAQIAVADGTTNGSVTLTFPVIPTRPSGTTYARFRLSTDVAGTNAIGAASDGEVEDYTFTITDPTGTATAPTEFDYGDAPDTGAGTGGGNYETTASDNGPSHVITSGLLLGAKVDGDDGTLQNSAANADDSFDIGFTDDEDGVLSPADLFATEGSAPTVTLLVTNTTGNAATLSGWIDYNRNGVFENASERVQSTIADGTTDDRVTLTFPVVPDGSSGTTYARFRLSTDAAADDATGAATDGEVEDYQFAITEPTDAPPFADSVVSIGDGLGGISAGTLNLYNFGGAVGHLGDLDGDGIDDLVTSGVEYSYSGGSFSITHAVEVLFLNADSTVKSHTRISNGQSGFSDDSLLAYGIGSAFANLGDIDGDGVADLAVGASAAGNKKDREGAVYILLLNTDGTVKDHVKISDGLSGMAEGSLQRRDSFGNSVAAIGDLDGDGVPDLAVGASGDSSFLGALYVLLLNPNGTVKSQVRIADGEGGFASGQLGTFARLGNSVTSMGDLDGDGITDLAVGAGGDGNGVGAIFTLLMNTDGTVKSQTKIADGVGGLTAGSIDNRDTFGSSLAGVGDLDGDGVNDLVVGAANDMVTGSYDGSIHVLLMQSDGTVKDQIRIGNGLGGLAAGTLGTYDRFGWSVASLGDQDGDGFNELAVGAPGSGVIHILSLVPPPPAADYGDAPDTGAGTGSGNYETSASDNGPSHTVVAGLFLGDTVDGGEDGTLQNARANADDVDGALPDDEDGVLSPATDLIGTVGAAPTVTLLVTNTTGSTATLNGWIDYNQDGVFDNATERAQASVADGTNAGRVTLTFPAIPDGSTGTTYARFRLSTDSAADNATGAATDGEVEDYTFEITAPAGLPVVADGFTKIAHQLNGGPTLADDDQFGSSVSVVGDLDGDGVSDLAVGAKYDDTGGPYRGAVHVLLLNADGTVKNSTKIASGTNGGPTLADYDSFGGSVASLGDLDGDGVADLAVGAKADNTGGTYRGAVHVLLLNADGTVKSSTKIASGTNGGPTLADFNGFGSSVASLGDLDGDGVADLAVGADLDSTNGTNRGAVHVLLLNTDGTVKSSTKIGDGIGGGPTLADFDFFGGSLAPLRDLDGDGVADLAVGGTFYNTVHVLLLNSDGTAKSSTKIASGTNGGPTLTNGDRFGTSVASLGDLDGDGVADLAVGADRDDTGGMDRGAVHVLLLNTDGTVKSSTKIGDGIGGGPTLANGDQFGRSVASLGDLDGDGVIELAVGADRDGTGGSNRGAVYILNLSPPLTVDFGDAPDTGVGTGSGNYETTAADGGPSHTVVAGIQLGASVDADNGTLQNVAANADDVDGALPDDEDGVLSPATDLIGTVGAAPTITLLVTNTTGSTATLNGWIDYNQDGVFDNATERAQASVADGTTDGRFTLTFPAIPDGSTGSTYARFRLSTDSAADNPTGAATDGEVEDFTFEITDPAGQPVTVASFLRIASGTNGGPALASRDYFGGSVASVGDLDGDGVADLAVGAKRDDTGGSNRGAVYVLFMNADGTVKSSTKIADGTGGGPTLADRDQFGTSVASLGDLDGDGLADLAVGAAIDGTGGTSRGAVHVLFMNADGTVKSSTKIASGTGGGPTLANFDFFGSSVASVGDLDGDGVVDLAVGATGDNTGGGSVGAMHVLLLNTDGTVKSSTKIASGTGPILAAFDYFGSSVAAVGDLDGDGVGDLAVGAMSDDTGGSAYSNRGAVHVLFMNANGTVKSSTKIASGIGGGPTLADSDYFGGSAAGVGDLDGDGVADLAVGARRDGTGGPYRGAVHVLLLNADGTVKSSTKIASGTGSGPTLANFDYFGSSVASVGDLDGDGVVDLAVGASYDYTNADTRGVVYILNLAPPPRVDYGDAPDTGVGTGAGNYQTTGADGGPSHTIVAGLQLGASVDGDSGTLQNVTASADDVDGALPDDEDGVLSPATDLIGTVGAAPTITLLVTNTTGSAATLNGWIDYNQDGVFDNAAERAQASVTDGTTDGRITLTFPTIPAGSTGTTYARFRLSTDSAADNATGAATDGEVEDYVFSITAPADGSVASFTQIADGTNGGPNLANFVRFGTSLARVGDLDGDGVDDLAVGAPSDNTGGAYRGAVHVLLMNANGTVKGSTKIASGTGGGPTLQDRDRFGASVTPLGDLDGDGVPELAVGARSDSTGGRYRGAVHVLFLNANGTAKGATKIASSTGGGPALSNYDSFGNAVARLGDLDGDGIPDLAVGAAGDDTGSSAAGAVYVMLLNADATVKSFTKIASATNGGATLRGGDNFGWSIAALKDLDMDGVADLAVGAVGDDTGGGNRGAVHVLLLNADGSAKNATKIAHRTGGGPTLENYDLFGHSVASAGDLDGDGVVDLVVGADRDGTGGNGRGALYTLLLNTDGSVKGSTNIASEVNGGPTLTDFDEFGLSVAFVGDLDGDGLAELAVGAPGDDTGGNGRGAVYIMSLAPQHSLPGKTPVSPLGSLIYDPVAQANIGTQGYVRHYEIPLDPAQTVTVLVEPDDRLQAVVEVRDGSNTLVGSSTATSAGQTVIVQTAPASTSGTYTVTIGGDNGTIGEFNAQVLLNAAVETERHDGVTNNDAANAQDISASFLPLGLPGAERGAVIGTVGAPPFLLFGADGDDSNLLLVDPTDGTPTVVSNGVGDSNGYTDLAYNSVTGIMYGSEADNNDGLFSIDLETGQETLVVSTSVSPVHAMAWSPDGMTLYAVSRGVFGTIDIADGMFTQIRNLANDGVDFIGGIAFQPGTGVLFAAENRGTNLYTINPADGTSTLIADTGESWNALEFLPDGTLLGGVATSGGCDDCDGSLREINPVTGAHTLIGIYAPGSENATGLEYAPATPEPEDLFSFPLEAGDLVSLAAFGIGSGELELLDPAENVLATGSGGATNVDLAISNFQVLASGTYYARVATSGNPVDYSLVVTRNAAFDQEDNSTSANAQSLGGASSVLGHLGPDGSDYYSFAATSGENIVLTTQTPAGGSGEFVNEFDPVIELFDPTGASVATDDNGGIDGRNASLSHLAQMTGTYTVRVTGANSSTGEYVLARPDFIAPTLTSFTRQTPTNQNTDADTLVFWATFDEAVTAVDAADFAVNGTTTATVTSVATADGGAGLLWDVTVSGGDLAGFSGSVSLDLSGSQNITDRAGNALPGTEPATDETYTLDNTAPSATSFTRQTPAAQNTNADSLVFRATFSEAVTAVDAADFAVNGTTTATVTNVVTADAGAGLLWDVTVSGGDLAGFNGTVGLDLSGSQNITDLVGNVLAGDGIGGPVSFSAPAGFGAGSVVNPLSLIAADIDGDGIPDLVAGNASGSTLSLLSGDGNGGFATATNRSFLNFTEPFGVAVGDVVGDGNADVVVAGTSSFRNIAVAAGDGTGSFTETLDLNSGAVNNALVLVDVDGDGLNDIVTSSRQNGTVSVFLNNGGNTFSTPTTVATTGGGGYQKLAFADLDGDGNLDIVTAHSYGALSVALGNGDGTFGAASNLLSGPPLDGLAVGDVDGDGVPDIVVSDTYVSGVRVLLGNGNGTFGTPADIPGGQPRALVLSDLNRDGDLDLVVSDRGANPVTIRLGNGDGTFGTAQTITVGTGTNRESLVVADFDQDGRPDIAITRIGTSSSDIAVLLNTTTGSVEPGTDEAYTLDNTAPSTTSFTRQTPAASLTNADSLVFRATFSEAVMAVDAADFAVNGTTTATVTSVTTADAGAGLLWDVTVSGGDLTGFTGTVGLDLSGAQNITDLAGNALPGTEPVTDETWSLDNLAPFKVSFRRQTPGASTTTANSLVFRAMFSESVTAVDVADFAVSGTTTATVTSVTTADAGAGLRWDVTISGGDLAVFNGVVGLDLSSSQNITDLAGNALELPVDQTYTLDNAAPAITSFTRQTPAAQNTGAGTLVFRATFSEAVTAVDAADFAVNGTTTATVTSVATADAGAGLLWDVTVSGGDLAGFDGVVGLDLSGSQNITDSVGNALPGSEPTTDETWSLDNTAPAVTSFTRQTPAAGNTDADTLVFRVTFSEAVTAVDAADFAVNGTTTATVTNVATADAGAGLLWDVTVSGGDLAGFGGVVGLDLSGSQNITDLAGNALPGTEPATDETYSVSNTPLATTSFTRQTPAAGNTNADTLVFRATFSKAVTAVDAADFAVNGTTTATVTSVATADAGAGLLWDVTVSGGDLAGFNGVVGLDLSGSQNIADLVGNALPGTEPSTDETWSLDNTAPTLSSFARQTPSTSPTNADSLVIRATFSEAVTAVDAADFAVNGTTTATVTSVATADAGAGLLWDITVSGGDLAGFDGVVGLDLSGSQNITDLAGNALPGTEPATDETWSLDNSAPAVTSFTRQTPAAQNTDADTLVFRATFSKAVTAVDAADFAVNGTTTATVTSVATADAGAGLLWDVTVSGGDLAGFDGVVGLDLSGSQNITDSVGNALPGSEPTTDETFTIDNTPPATTSFTRQTPSTSPTRADSLVFRATFTAAVQNVDIGDFAVDGATTAAVTGVTSADSNAGLLWDVTVSGGDLAGFEGSVGLSLSGSQDITDLAGNALPGSEPATDETYTLDNTAPSVTVNQAAGQADPTNGSTINFTVLFGESVSGFATGDVTLGGTAGATTATVSEVSPNNGTTYNVAVTGMTGSGTVTASIGASVASDAAGNANAAGSSTDNSVTYDVTAPMAAISGPASPVVTAPFDVTIDFGEPVSGFVSGDISVGNGSVTGFQDDGGGQFTVEITPGSDGAVTVDVAANVASDTAGNANTAANQYSVTAEPSGAPIGILVVGPDQFNWDAGSRVRVYDADTLTEKFSFDAGSIGFQGGVRVATGDVNGDGTADVITALGSGALNAVSVWDGRSGTQIGSTIAPFAFNFGGLYVAATDLVTSSGNAGPDGFADVIVGRTRGAGPEVQIYSGGASGLTLVRTFAPYGSAFFGGVRVATGDVNGDGTPEIITAPTSGRLTEVRVFDTDGTQLSNTATWDFNFSGAFVAAADVNDDGRADVIVGLDASGTGPQVRTYHGQADGSLAFSTEFSAYETGFAGGVRVATVEQVDGTRLIVTGRGSGGPTPGGAIASDVRLFETDGTPVDQLQPYNIFARSGVFVAGATSGGDSPLHADSTGEASEAEPLTEADLEPVVQQAIALWSAAVPGAAEQLSGVTFRIMSLPGTSLGATLDSEIRLDRDAAGHGWFIDPTLDSHEEFAWESTGRWQTSDGPAAGRMDLLTVVAHELGHVLELRHGDTTHPVMNNPLSAGVRSVPLSGADVNGDGRVTALDALLTIRGLRDRDGSSPRLDVNGDGHLTALDSLLVIDRLSRSRASSGMLVEGEPLRPAMLAEGEPLRAARSSSQMPWRDDTLTDASEEDDDELDGILNELAADITAAWGE